MTAEFDAVFERLKGFFAAHEAKAVVLHDEPHRYYLGTHEVRAKDGYRTWLGGVEVKKAYVSAHLIPVYAHPDMLEALSPELRKRMQGKSCFNFKRIDETLLAEMQALVDRGVKQFEADGRL